MTQHELKQLILAELKSCFFETKEFRKENTMKRSDLKGLIKEVVRQCVKENGPQYKVLNGKTQINDPSDVRARDRVNSDPEINEEFPPADGGTPETPDVPETPEGEEHEEYNEQDEIRLIKAMGQAIIKLLQMHKEMEDGEEEPVEPEADVDQAPPEEPVDENHKVQSRSYRTVGDQLNDPANVRDPDIPLG